jgi:hypothetical protein
MFWKPHRCLLHLKPAHCAGLVTRASQMGGREARTSRGGKDGSSPAKTAVELSRLLKSQMGRAQPPSFSSHQAEQNGRAPDSGGLPTPVCSGEKRDRAPGCLPDFPFSGLLVHSSCTHLPIPSFLMSTCCMSSTGLWARLQGLVRQTVPYFPPITGKEWRGGQGLCTQIIQ